MSCLTFGLPAPKSRKEFSREWARKILVSYFTRTEKGWLLGDVLKVVDVDAKDNPHPGNLSDSYVADITYKSRSEAEHETESWFVKVPKSALTSSMDAVEIFAYKELFPKLQRIIEACELDFRLPIPLMYHCAHKGDGKCDVLVMENLRDQHFKPLRPGTCSLSYMRATMRSLATIHATTFAFQQIQGGSEALLKRYPIIKEDTLPRSCLIKETVEMYLLPYIIYMSFIQPDLQHQLALLLKFHKYIFPVFKNVSKDVRSLGKTIIHGDSKIDNFMYKKIVYSLEEEYSAIIIDWQGVCRDYVTGDLIWTLYGFMKNLPDKNATVDTFMDYSLEFYHKELLSLLKSLSVDNGLLPDDEYDAVVAIRKGFIFEFLKVAIIKPILNLKDPDALLRWSRSKIEGESYSDEPVPLPEESQIFKTGSNFANFIHLYFTIATEIGVFHELGELCIAAVREAIFGGAEEDEDEDSKEMTKEEDTTEKSLPNGSEDSHKLEERTEKEDKDSRNSENPLQSFEKNEKNETLPNSSQTKEENDGEVVVETINYTLKIAS